MKGGGKFNSGEEEMRFDKNLETFLKESGGKVIAVVGGFGSGKTEISLNLVMGLREYHRDVTIVDLDIVNPYFRCREARDLVRSRSISFILPPEEQMEADIPIIVPEIRATLQSPKGAVVLDVGGDDIGSRVLGSFKGLIDEDNFEMWNVVNVNRPFTSDVEGGIRILKEIELSSRMKVTGLVSNAHLMEYTTVSTIYEGYEVVKEMGEKLSLPVRFVGAETGMLSEAERERFECPVFPMKRYLKFPWESRIGKD